MEGEPERSESSGEQEVPTRAKDSGCKKGHGFPGGMKAVGAPGQGRDGFAGKCRNGRGTRKGFSITREEESSEERSPRALGAERGPPG